MNRQTQVYCCCSAIRMGEVFTEANITAKRPGTVSPMQWDAWIGRRALRDFAVDELIE